MKDFKRIKSYNKKYVEELDRALKVIKPYLVQAFTLFYGSEYLSYIKKTLEKINYTYFLSEHYFRLLEQKSFGLSNKDRRVTEYYLEYLKDRQFYKKKNLKSLILHSDFDKELFVSAHFRKYLFFGEAAYVTFNEQESTILLPIFVIDLKTVIHEINHVFMSEVVATTGEGVVIPRLFLLDECDELFNDLIAEQILRIYRQIRAPIPYTLRRFQLLSSYQQYLSLIDPFYQSFLPLIKKSIMTKNYNLLLESVGRDDFPLYCLLIQKCFLQKGFRKREQNLLNEAVLRMRDHAFHLSFSSYEDCFYELESLGYRIRKLV